MKHIKLRGKLKEDYLFGKQVEVTVVEQTHYGVHFGNRSDVFRSYKGFSIRSGNFIPCAGASVLWLNGVAKNPQQFTVSLNQWKWIKELVQEYNEWGRTQ